MQSKYEGLDKLGRRAASTLAESPIDALKREMLEESGLNVLWTGGI
jgi:hypothetical protein